jgi:hypothetical protein
MYHSEATLLPDGRVRVSGSDPEAAGFTGELRIEVYIPPYLSQGLTQPIVDGAEYGLGLRRTVPDYRAVVPRRGSAVSLVAAVSSTHGNVMGGRVIFPAVSCVGTVCMVTAPPNEKVSPPGWHQLFVLDGSTPSHGVFVRVGGNR